MGLREMDVGVGAIGVRLFHDGDPSAAGLLEAMAMASVVAATRDEGGQGEERAERGREEALVFPSLAHPTVALTRRALAPKQL